jgi:glycosyltransferase involved in cell wall biosynthesis
MTYRPQPDQTSEVLPSTGSRQAKICHISKVTGISGSEKHLLILLGSLVARGYDTTCLVLEEAARPVGYYADQLAAKGVQTARIRINGDLDPWLIIRLYRQFRRGDYDLVHTHLIHADLYGSVAAKLAGVPAIVSTRHNEDRFREHPFFIFLNHLIAPLHQRVIVISKALGFYTARLEGVNPARIAPIYYGLPFADLPRPGEVRREFHLPADAPVIGTVGRLTEQKGQRTLLHAFARVLGDHPGAYLFIVGEGELRSTLQTLAQELDIAGRVIFTGYRDDAPRLMADFDVVAVPSLWEGFGLVLLEAMNAGRPVVASRVSAIPEIVLDGETGLLVPPDDAEALAAALGRLLGDHALAGEMGRRGRERLRSHFSVERMVDETEALYRDLLGHGI